jgi:hypothetical protein
MLNVARAKRGEPGLDGMINVFRFIRLWWEEVTSVGLGFKVLVPVKSEEREADSEATQMVLIEVMMQ